MCRARRFDSCTRYEKFTIPTIKKNCEQTVMKKFRFCEDNKENLNILKSCYLYEKLLLYICF